MVSVRICSMICVSATAADPCDKLINEVKKAVSDVDRTNGTLLGTLSNGTHVFEKEAEALQGWLGGAGQLGQDFTTGFNAMLQAGKRQLLLRFRIYFDEKTIKGWSLLLAP
ncbi:unnamed protein product, partial [Didymodactylos carnosus]